MPISIEKVLVLIPSQRGFLVESLAGESEQYKQQIHVEILQPISPDKLESNIVNAVNNHPILRTVFDWAEGVPAQVVINGAKAVINQVQLGKEAEIDDILRLERASIQTLDTAPPVRFMIIKGVTLGLIVTYSHIILDGPSIRMLLKEVVSGDAEQLYNSEDYLQWYNNNIKQKEKRAWAHELKSITFRDTELGIASKDSHQLDSITLSDAFSDNLLRASKKFSITSAVYMQTLWDHWVSSYFDKQNFVYGLVTSTRVPGVCDYSLGPYINTIPWTTHLPTNSFSNALKQTSNKQSEIVKAKHVSLGDIAKEINPAVLGIEVILNINTRPVETSKLYKVIHTYENTGYKLSVDIDITNCVSLQFSGLIDNNTQALSSFASYCEGQSKQEKLLTVTKVYNHKPLIKMAPKKSIFDNSLLLRGLVAQAIHEQPEDINMNSSLLENGGDSISALRLKSLLRANAYDVSIADILQTPSLEELIGFITVLKTQPMTSICHNDFEKGKYLLGKDFEAISIIPDCVKTIVKAYRLGFGQDYHEQAGFRLLSSFNKEIMQQAIDTISKEYPTLRLYYPNELPDIQLLSVNHRVEFESRQASTQSFDEYVSSLSSEFMDKPIDISSGSIVRIVVGIKSEDEWYFFMSFSALITDGWSFSTILLRLFDCYDQINDRSLKRLPVENYMQHCLDSGNHNIIDTYDFDVVSKDYSFTINGNDFTIDSETSSKIQEYAKHKKITLSNALLDFAIQSLPKEFSEIVIYQDTRHDPDVMDMVGPFSVLTRNTINNSNGIKRAYYVFENYPKTSENKLREHKIKSFNEHGNWRRDILPPNVDLGLICDPQESTINVRILTRESLPKSNLDPQAYWYNLVSIVKKELRK